MCITIVLSPPADELLFSTSASASEQTHLQAPLSRLGLLARPRVPGGHGAVAGHAVVGPLPPPAERPGAADAHLGGVEREHGELRSRQRFWKMGRKVTIAEEKICLLAVPLKCIAKRNVVFICPSFFFSPQAFAISRNRRLRIINLTQTRRVEISSAFAFFRLCSHKLFVSCERLTDRGYFSNPTTQLYIL